MRRRVVVTGMGTVNPLGLNVESFWEGLVAGKSGIGPVTLFDASNYTSRIAGEVKNFDPAGYIDKKRVRRMDRMVQFSVVSAHQAMVDAGLIDEGGGLKGYQPNQVGTIVGSGIGGLATLEKQHSILLERGPEKVSPFLIPMMIADMAAGEISIRYNLKGANFAVVSACASAAHAIGESFHIIQLGKADCMITGGSEATITPIGLAGFCSIRALSTRNDDPEAASRPFERDRDGFVMSEGCGILVLEAEETALARGARIYAELAGYGLSADAHHITQPAPGGEGMKFCMEMALRDAGITTIDVDYINAHGTATEYNDKFETEAIRSLFGDKVKSLPVSSIKSMIGHLLGAAGGVEAIATIKTINESLIPPTINYQNPDPDCDLDYVPNRARKQDVRVALSNNFGFGGHNACLVFRKYPG